MAKNSSSKKISSGDKSKSSRSKKSGGFFSRQLEYKDDKYRINRFYNKLLDLLKFKSGDKKTNIKLQKYKNYNFIKNSLIFLAMEYLIGIGIINTLPYPEYKTVYIAAFASIFMFAIFNVYKHFKSLKNKTFMPYLQVVLGVLHILVFLILLKQI